MRPNKLHEGALSVTLDGLLDKEVKQASKKVPITNNLPGIILQGQDQHLVSLHLINASKMQRLLDKRNRPEITSSVAWETIVTAETTHQCISTAIPACRLTRQALVVANEAALVAQAAAVVTKA